MEKINYRKDDPSLEQALNQAIKRHPSNYELESDIPNLEVYKEFDDCSSNLAYLELHKEGNRDLDDKVKNAVYQYIKYLRFNLS